MKLAVKIPVTLALVTVALGVALALYVHVSMSAFTDQAARDEALAQLRVAAKALAGKYANASLGEIAVTVAAGKTVFDFGEFKSEVGTIKNPDGTISFSTIVTGLSGLDFVAGTADGKPTLTMRDGQHEYVFLAR